MATSQFTIFKATSHRVLNLPVIRRPRAAVAAGAALGSATRTLAQAATAVTSVVRTGVPSGRRWRATLIAALGLVMAIAGASPAAASVAGPQHWHVPGRASGSGFTLAQAPSALRAAARTTLGMPLPGTAGVHQQAKLTASDAVTGDAFGGSVAIFGNTAVVGAPQKNSFTGAAYPIRASGPSGPSWPPTAPRATTSAGWWPSPSPPSW
jgi:hypothetical protein